MTLKDSRVLIIGGTSGIGLAVATAAASRGATPIVVSRKQASVNRALQTLPPRAEGLTVDLTDEGSISSLVAAAGRLDHLVYTAGEPLELTLLADLNTDTAHRLLDTRPFGALAVVRAVAPMLSHTGSITLTSGTAAERPGSGWAVGAAVSGAMISLTRALAVELAPLRVNVVVPGVTRSPVWSELTDAARDELYTWDSELLLGRVAEVDDIALGYVYAMEQTYGTGATINVDGGAVLV